MLWGRQENGVVSKNAWTIVDYTHVQSVPNTLTPISKRRPTVIKFNVQRNYRFM